MIHCESTKGELANEFVSMVSTLCCFFILGLSSIYVVFRFQDALSSDLVVSPAVLASVDDANVDSANAGKRSIGGSADNVGSASDLTFEDDAMDEEYDYLNDDDLSDTDVIDYEYNFYADDAEYLKLQAQFDCVDLPPGVEATVPWLQDPSKIEKFLASAASSSSASSSLKAATSSTVRMGEEIDDVLRKFIYFKQFDTVTDCSDHYFMNYKGSAPLVIYEPKNLDFYCP